MKAARHGIAFVLATLLGMTGVLSQGVPFKTFTLKNGLRIILAEDHLAPTYSLSMTYDVGSRNERPGRTGFAHLFEHMMFEGSENVGKGEHGLTIINNGGSRNGTTNADRTAYYETLPATQIDMGLFLEADRMRSLAITQVNFDNQRAIVQEERRLSYDNQPYGRTNEVILDTVYVNFAYKHSTIGSMSDLNAATVGDAAEFFRMYYAPNNTVLAMVGDFKTEEVLAKIEKYFGDIPRQSVAPVPDTTEPKQTTERRKIHEDPLAQVPRLNVVFKIPAGNTPEWDTLAVTAQILSGGQSSRLYQKLVKQRQVATSAGAAAQERRGPSLFVITVDVQPGRSPVDVEALVYEELERLKSQPVADAELEEVRMGIRRLEVEQQIGTLNRANLLGQFAVYYNDPGLIKHPWTEAKSGNSRADSTSGTDVFCRDQSDGDRDRSDASADWQTDHDGRRTMKRDVMILVAAIVTCGATMSGVQGPAAPTPTKVERKNRVPVNNDVLRVTLPKAIEATLSNGLTVLILEDQRLPRVSLQYTVGGAGPIHEPANLPGLANITAQLMREGTKTRTSAEFASAVEGLGATLTVGAAFGSEAALLTASGLSDQFDRGLHSPTMPCSTPRSAPTSWPSSRNGSGQICASSDPHRPFCLLSGSVRPSTVVIPPQ